MMSPAKPFAGAGQIGVVVAHGVGETIPGESVRSLVEGLQTADPKFEPAGFDKIFRADTDFDKAVPVTIQEGHLTTGTTVRFAELYWADIASVRPGRVSALLGFLRIMFEAHHLIDGLLRGTTGFLGRTYIASLGLAAAWLRGPIAGLSINFIGCGLILFALSFVTRFLFGLHPGHPWMAAIESGVLLSLFVAVAFVGFARAGSWALSDAVWGDIALGAAGVAVILAFLTILQFALTGGAGQTLVEKFNFYYPYLRVVWVPWSLAIIIAVIVLVWTYVTDRFRTRPSVTPAWPLSLALVLLQSSLWLLLVPGASYILVNQLGLLTPFYAGCPLDNRNPAQEACEKALAEGGLYHSELGLVFLVNLVALAIVGLAVWRVVHLRQERVQRHRALSPSELRDRLPRLVVSALIVGAVLFGATLVLLFLGLVLDHTPFLREWNLNLLPQSMAHIYERIYSPGVRNVIALLFWLPFAFSWLWTFVEQPVSNYAMTSARQIIDHFYRPRMGYAWHLNRSKRPEEEAVPRRDRVQQRLDAVIRTMIEDGKKSQMPWEGLVFVAHSQGSMIVYEFLHRNRDWIAGLHIPVHVVTMGSPIGWVYNYYAHQYGDLAEPLNGIGANVASWTNLYRSHDPIAGPISLTGPIAVKNEILPPGPNAHMYYWNDPAVCRVVHATFASVDRNGAKAG